jgi:hypothetical protein
MALFDDAGTITNIIRPGQLDQTGDINATAVTEYRDQVEHTLARRSVLAPLIPIRPVRGTNSVGNFGFGKSTIGKVTPGQAPDATKNDVGRVRLTIDTLVYTRHVIPVLEEFQTSYDARIELGTEDGLEMAKFHDQAFFIQAAKAGMLTNSAYSGVSGKPAGYTGGVQVTLSDAADALDPSRFYSALGDANAQFMLRDVNPAMDGLIIAVNPIQFNVLQQAEQIVNGNYVTAQGQVMTGVDIFKAWGCPIVSTNNIPQANISGHLLSTTANSNAYDGDFSKVVAVIVSAKALLAGETIALNSDVFYDKIYKSWFVDSERAFGVTPDRAEYAGVILKP